MNLFKTLLELALSIFAKKEITVSIPIGSVNEEEKVEEAPKTETIKLVLTHTRFCPEGIFGKLEKDNGEHISYTLEHSYDNKPKLANGTYTCVRGPHRLHGMTEDFTTFEIKGVPEFDGKPVSGVLFHWGNYQKDSEGCVLMGATETPTMITNSRTTFAGFMKWLDGVDSFELEVKS